MIRFIFIIRKTHTLQIFDSRSKLVVFLSAFLQRLIHCFYLALPPLTADPGALSIFKEPIVFHGPIGSHLFEWLFGDNSYVYGKLSNSYDAILINFIMAANERLRPSVLFGFGVIFIKFFIVAIYVDNAIREVFQHVIWHYGRICLQNLSSNSLSWNLSLWLCVVIWA